MKKVGEILIVASIVAVFAIVAVVVSLSGVKNGGQNYVKLEVNPKIEFVTNSKDKVITAFPLNAEAKELMINETFVGLNIADATKKYLELCKALNYLDVERTDNAVKLTVVSGLTQALEVKIYREINNYLTKNEIMGVIVENASDLNTFKKAKKLGVSNGKFALVEAVARLYPDEQKQEIKELNEKQLIEKIATAHAELTMGVETFSETEINNKAKLIDVNRLKLEHHKNNITNKSQSKFKENYVAHSKKTLRKYEQNFDHMHETWVLNRTNAYLA